jgi:hypothetical protein
MSHLGLSFRWKRRSLTCVLGFFVTKDPETGFTRWWSLVGLLSEINDT